MKIEKRINPFQELYLTEYMGDNKFVKLFSPLMVSHALPLFQPGHVVLKGLPGAGKTMLLNLLKPEIRIAYSKNNIEFPVPPIYSKFIGIGINLKRSGIIDFGQRPFTDNNNNIIKYLPLYFGDFLNFWLVDDLLRSCELLRCNEKVSEELGLKYSKNNLEEFTKKFINLSCWYNYFSSCKSFEDIRHKISSRITTYRAYLNFNIDEIPAEIHNSKTNIGDPITQTVKLLKEFAILDDEIEVYVRIDQYEELEWLNGKLNTIGLEFQNIINKLLGSRDSYISYRIGTRNFAWNLRPKVMFGTNAILEKNRNYFEISIDNFLKRKENRRTWIFPEIVEDIFQRRLNFSNYELKITKDKIKHCFDNSLPAHVISKTIYYPKNREKAVKIDNHWPVEWKSFLINLAHEDPFSARLAEAWARQEGIDKKNVMYNIPQRPFPWDEKKWWKKERQEQALLQLASRNSQQLHWSGYDDIIALSGGNILIFLNICQHIWDVWMRDSRSNSNLDELPKVDAKIQSIGIIEASINWLEDLEHERGGKARKLFIRYIGNKFFQTLTQDEAMSNPGHNGFTLDIDDLNNDEEISRFLYNCSDYGDLQDIIHTSKTKDKKKRVKWYLHPILSPYFKIPYVHTKEPIYLNITHLRKWLIESGAINYRENLPSQKLIDF